MFMFVTSASGQSFFDNGRNAVFGFGSAVLSADDTSIGFEDNYLLGLGYQRAWGDWGALLYGLEGGLAQRFGQTYTLEAWGGIFARYNIDVGSLRIAPALTFGLSTVTDPMIGGETNRQDDNGDGDAHLLFYLGPEISFGMAEHPEYEVFARLHHRSGAWGTLGEMHGAADAFALGVRTFF